ncbi:MAG: hypothetical protein AAFV69_00565 [Pseudomonadota bacterium]
MSSFKSVDVGEIIARGNIRDGDVQRLRRAFYADGDISADEASQLFAIHDACNVQDDSWADFFVEAVSDYMVRQAQPEGYVTVENADWLLEAISRDGFVQTKTELDALIRVIDDARWSPPRLIAFALDQVKLAVIEGNGPLRSGQQLQAGLIADAEVDLIRRMIYAFGGDGCIGVTRAEAEKLFEIDAALLDASQCPAWTELFVKAVANVVMGSSGYAVPSREEALRSEAWLDEAGGTLDPAAMVTSIARQGLSGVISAYRQQSSEERAIARLERQRLEIVTGEELTQDEITWICEQIERDGLLSANEHALIQFLQEEAPALDARLEDVVRRLAAAA